MDEEDKKRKMLEELNQERLALFRILPVEVVEKFSKEEMMAFLKGEDLPESMEEKLSEYLVD